MLIEVVIFGEGCGNLYIKENNDFDGLKYIIYINFYF